MGDLYVKIGLLLFVLVLTVATRRQRRKSDPSLTPIERNTRSRADLRSSVSYMQIQTVLGVGIAVALAVAGQLWLGVILAVLILLAYVFFEHFVRKRLKD